MERILKKQFFLFLIGIMFCGIINAQTQKFNKDVVLHECDGGFSIKPEISVADNGWIYVLMNKYNHPSENDETRIYRSKDGGITFEQIWQKTNATDVKQGGRDFVVTGNDPSNITIWYVYADNDTQSGSTFVEILKMDADGNGETSKYNHDFLTTVTHDVAISTNARSPDNEWTPFTIGFAVSSNYGEKGYIDYVSSKDGGATFTKKDMYSKDSSKFGYIDISIGQGLATAWRPVVGVVFEMDKDSEENIGFIRAIADGEAVKNVLQVNKKYSATDKTKQPKIQWLCNNTLDELNNFMIVYSSLKGEDWDLVKIYPSTNYNHSENHTLDNLNWFLASSTSYCKEEYPDLAYDKKNNKYILVYRESCNNAYTLKCKSQSYTEIRASAWSNIGNISSTSTGKNFYYSPAVDVDPTRGKACFAFEHYIIDSLNITQLVFDSEWNTNIEEHEIAKNAINVYPNPASNVLNMISENVNELITICDLSGKVVYSEQASEKQSSIDISNLSAGMYIVRIGDKATKFVKE
ncbi:MAG: T9SS type A sorting domain-containing protein [Bacteroidales bacterium]|nr:T9SS type A sorting domain-containing protein [Bacteroidales bacterium]